MRAGAHVYATKRWQRLRFLAKRRDGFACVKCGARAALECDHVKPVRTHPELSFALENLQTLCVACHSAKTNEEMGRAPNPARDAWRELLKIPVMRNERKIECLSQ